MKKTVFEIQKMDCPSEENLIRLKLKQNTEVKQLDFDLENRVLTVIHEGEFTKIEKEIHSLNLNEKIISSGVFTGIIANEDSNQKLLLSTILGINFVFFLIELISGLYSQSMGLLADSLDMLADAFVYGISLLAIGKSVTHKRSVAKLAGYFQLILALGGFIEVVRRFISPEATPNFGIMMFISVLALVANAYCLYLIQKSRSKNEAHIKASMIFTSNDVIVNLGVILAGVLVYFFRTNVPDLIVGSVVFVVVIAGAFRILKLK